MSKPQRAQRSAAATSRPSRGARFETLERRQLLSTTSGLTATYYDNRDFTGPSVTRVDARVDFDWQAGAPHASIGSDTFSARWTGKILPAHSERYTFYLSGDDGVRLVVNGQLVVDGWQADVSFQHSGSIEFQGGRLYDIKLEYREDYGSSHVNLAWASASQPKQIVPTTALFPAEAVTATPVPAAPAPSLLEFNVYDATLLRNKPAPTLAGMQEIRFIYPYMHNDMGLWPAEDRSGIPSVARFQRILKDIKPGTPVVLDVEQWYHDTSNEAVWRDTYAKLAQTVRNFKAARPDLPVACYDMLPFGFNASVHNDKADLARFEMQMSLLLEPDSIAHLVDFQANPASANWAWSRSATTEQWETWIHWRSNAAGLFGKPVFWIVEPYVAGTKQLVSQARWDHQMRVTREVGASVIVWSDYVPSYKSSDYWYQSLLP
jgi:hypothetical protein